MVFNFERTFSFERTGNNHDKSTSLDAMEVIDDIDDKPKMFDDVNPNNKVDGASSSYQAYCDLNILGDSDDLFPEDDGDDDEFLQQAIFASTSLSGTNMDIESTYDNGVFGRLAPP